MDHSSSIESSRRSVPLMTESTLRARIVANTSGHALNQLPETNPSVTFLEDMPATLASSVPALSRPATTMKVDH